MNSATDSPTQPDAVPSAPAASSAPEVPVVFVGGTGRSGTHIVSRLLSKGKGLKAIPVECRFHVDDDGFPGLLAGTTSKGHFVRRMRGFWWRGFQTNRWRGMHKIIDRDRYDAAVDRFERDYDDDPKGACRRLFFDLLTPEDGTSAIVEQSCDVIAAAPTLIELFPDARFIHVVRDGRDASASRVSQGFRWLVWPRTRTQGLVWWERRMRAIGDGAHAIPAERLHVVELARLLGPGRLKQLRPLARAAGLHQPGKRMRRFMKVKMNPGAAHSERWRDGLSQRRQAKLDARYTEIVDGLVADGVSGTELLKIAHERPRG